MTALKRICIFTLTLLTMVQSLWATKFIEMKVVDQNYLMLHFKDGIVEFVDDGLGSHAYQGHHSETSNSDAVKYGKALDLDEVATTSNWKIKSVDDANYNGAGLAPVKVYRKSRVNGMSMERWGSGDWVFDNTNEHFIYLELPHGLQNDKTYTIEIGSALNSDIDNAELIYNIFQSPSEAIHTNLVGYMSSSRVKAADLYHFLGDGGNRDYSDFAGNIVYIYNVDTGVSEEVGSVVFWMKNKKEKNHNLTGSDVWNIDFTGFTTPGTYRLAVEGIGCSQDFEIRDDIYHDPYKLAVLGYFYMRIGQDNLEMIPVPRRPLYIQNQDPSNCKIYITDMDPYHPQWSSFANGDKWDRPEDWAEFKKAGNPTNPRAIGGHSDALDWDRHLGHVKNVYDLCLAYIVSGGTLNDDDLRIAESGNGIPDILDEVRNEVDFWLNLRFEGGYSHGVTNPDNSNRLYQADNTAIAAWANALNSSMLAFCFQLAGMTELKNTYQDSAVVAYTYAANLNDTMLDEKLEGIRGRDLKMMAAAYLYNLTGDTVYEDVVKEESMVTGPGSAVHQQNSFNQLWGTAAYLLTNQPVNYPGLQADMKTAISNNAQLKETGKVTSRPSRRGRSDDQSWWQTSQDMHRTILAHLISDNATDKTRYLDAMLLEADWGLGRNPLNMIQMTTATTELEDKRSVENCYTSGRDDGTPGLHPGHTPYLNIDAWGGSMTGSNPQYVLDDFYPDSDTWPHASKYINTRYIWAHSEFTPRQTMRGKALLYAYLYSLSKSGEGIGDVLIADAGKDQRIIDEDENGKETVELNASKSYSSKSHIVSYTWKLNDQVIATGKTATVELELGNHTITLEVVDDNASTAVDEVKVNIISKSVDIGADFNFEAPEQFEEWGVENWGDFGGSPLAFHSSDAAHTGSYSFKIEADFSPGAEHALRRNGELDANVLAITYYLWVPQNLVDVAIEVRKNSPSDEGGIQNYLMHTSWQWVSKWTAFADLVGDDWNELTLDVPVDVDPTKIQSIGVSFKTNGVDAGDNVVYIDDIVYARDETSAIISQQANTQIPDSYELFQNYPNPFNPLTRIKFNLPTESQVDLSIYDINGRKVKALIHENKNAGQHEVTVDTKSMAGGVYFYALKAGSFKEIKKMTLLK